MPSKLTKAVSRVTVALLLRDAGVDKSIVCTLYPNGTIGLRPSGARVAREEVISMVSAYETAIKQRVAFNRAETHGMVTKVKRGLLS